MRGGRKGRRFFATPREVKSWKDKTPGEHAAPTQTNHLGCEKGYGFSDGRNPLKLQLKA
jgi:hypothetical protein